MITTRPPATAILTPERVAAAPVTTPPEHTITVVAELSNKAHAEVNTTSTATVTKPMSPNAANPLSVSNPFVYFMRDTGNYL